MQRRGDDKDIAAKVTFNRTSAIGLQSDGRSRIRGKEEAVERKAKSKPQVIGQPLADRSTHMCDWSKSEGRQLRPWRRHSTKPCTSLNGDHRLALVGMERIRADAYAEPRKHSKSAQGSNP